MSALMVNLEFVRIYLKDFLVIESGSFEELSAKVKEVMKQLQLADLKWNIDKCKYALPNV